MVCRPTFSYPSSGPAGLLKGKRAFLVLASGGIYSDGPAKAFDFQEPYLRTILGFMGITEVDVVRVEGVAMQRRCAEEALASATERSKQIVAKAA